MSRESFEDDLQSFIDAILLSKDKKLYIPSLVLLYTLIDTLAWLSLPEDKEDVTGKDFKDWVEKYMLPGSRNLNCTSSDIYSARCGLLHTHTSESSGTRNGKAKEIRYTWGAYATAPLQQSVDTLKPDTTIFIRIDALLACFFKGVVRFRKVYETYNKNSYVWKRAAKFFGNIPGFSFEHRHN